MRKKASKAGVVSSFEPLEGRALLSGLLPSIAAITVVQATTGTDLFPLFNGSVLNLTQLGAISIEADTDVAATDVVFTLDGKTIETDTAAPFDIQGDVAGAPNTWAATAGNHTLVMTPYLNSTAGQATTVTFSVTGTTTVPVTPPVTPPVAPPVTPPVVTPPVTPPGSSTKLTGTLIGTSGSFRNLGNTIANAVDGNLTTYFDAPTASGSWVGYDLLSGYQITQVRYAPRSGYSSRMVGGVFQGSNVADFSSGVTTLFTVTASPATNVYTAGAVTDTGSYRYVRYLSPTNGDCNVSEVEFDGFSTASTLIPQPTAVPDSPVVSGNATAGDVHLSWTEDAASQVDTYTIQRQGPDDAGYVTIGTVNGTQTVYDDLNVLPSSSYSYQIIANNSLGSSNPSTPVTEITPAPPVNPWTDLDIGSVGETGSASMSVNGTLTVNGSGADIGSSYDAFNFDYQTMVGNGTIIAQVTSETNTNTSAKSGIMIREAAEYDSRYVLLALTPANTVIMQSRSTSNNSPSYSTSVSAKAGVWLKLTRNGSSFSGYVSIDGVNWTSVGTATNTMVNNVLAGLAVTAHDTTKICTATFTSASLTTTGTEASAWSDGATAPMNRWESETFTYNGRMYVFGGFIDTHLDATSECDVYDPASNTWSYLTTVPTGALSHASVAVVGNIVYLAGGDLGTFTYGKTKTSTAEVLAYNLWTGQWSSITSLPAAESCGGLAAINNHLYYYGGLNANDTADLTNTWGIDLANTNAGWKAEAAMPNGRNHLGSAVINGIAYAVGGAHLYNQTKGNTSELDAYNPATNKWTTEAALPMTWSSNETTTLVVNNKIVLIGGQTNGGYDGIYLSQIEEYNPTGNKWTSPGNLPEPNEGESAAYINGELIVADGTVDNLGGWSQDQTWLDSEISL